MKKTKILYFVLTDRGWGSEVLHMLYGLSYAEKMGMEFMLHSIAWNCSIKRGWTDYFEPPPFKQPNKSLRFLLLSIAMRFLAKRISLAIFQWEERKVITARNIIGTILDLLKYTNQNNITYTAAKNLFYAAVSIIKHKRLVPIYERSIESHFNTRQEIKENMESFIQKMNKLLVPIWVLNADTKAMVEKKLLQDEKYAVFHIRRGDKVQDKEDRAYHTKEYIALFLRLKKQIKTIFIMTDDFSTYEEVKQFLPDYNVISFSTKDKRGHQQREFNKLSKSERKKETINLLTEIEIAKRSDVFIGSHRSNLYTLIQFLKVDNCYNVSPLGMI